MARELANFQCFGERAKKCNARVFLAAGVPEWTTSGSALHPGFPASLPPHHPPCVPWAKVSLTAGLPSPNCSCMLWVSPKMPKRRQTGRLLTKLYKAGSLQTTATVVEEFSVNVAKQWHHHPYTRCCYWNMGLTRKRLWQAGKRGKGRGDFKHPTQCRERKPCVCAYVSSLSVCWPQAHLSLGKAPLCSVLAFRIQSYPPLCDPFHPDSLPMIAS